MAFLPELVILLVVSALIGYLCQRIGLVPIVGFLLAGVVLGPNTTGLVVNQELIDAAAEIGVILLLFTIGLEFSLDQLARIRRLIFIGGGVQVALVVGLATGALLLLGVSWQVGLFTACLLALSSTAVVMKLLADRGETGSTGGQIALGILIFQDLAVVAMVLLVPMLGGEGGSLLSVAQAIGIALAIIAAVLIVARRVMPPLMEAVARTCSQEIFLLTVVAICFVTAYLTSLAGVSLSLGAFLAGLLVSDTRFREYALGEILPLQVLFSATFFVSVGLLLDIGFLIANLPLVLGLVGAILLLKLLTTGLSVRALGYSAGTVAYTSLLLGQIGEFSLVLERTGREAGLSPGGLGETGTQSFIAATVVLIVLTPFLALAGEALQRRFAKHVATPDERGQTPEGEHDGFGQLRDHVIIAGYGPAGQALAQAMRQASLPYGILTLSPGGATEAEQQGLTVLRSDYARRHTLDLAGIRHARALVIADDNTAMTERVVAVARGFNPDLKIVVRARTDEDARDLNRAGASFSVVEESASVAQLVGHVLRDYQLGPETIDQVVEAVGLSGRPNGASRAPVRLQEGGRGRQRCAHAAAVGEVVPHGSGCEECLRIGDTWVHLRVCMTCGHIGCCDSSKNKHAAKHFHETEHPIMRSIEPGETWGWCYVDKVEL